MMKKTFYNFFLATAFLQATFTNAQVGINISQPNSKTLLHISERSESTKSSPEKFGGVIHPRYTTSERDNNFKNLTAEENGLTIFNTTSNCYNVYRYHQNIGDWEELCSESKADFTFTDCNTITVVGSFLSDKPLDAQNVYIEVPIKVNRIGTYNVSTNTVNGVNFGASGTFTHTGSQTIRLYPINITGTPQAGTFAFSLSINTTSTITCNNIRVKFVSRSQSVMKILNVVGSDGTSLEDDNNSAGLVYKWLRGNNMIGAARPATYYSGTQSIVVENVKLDKLALLEDALATASGIHIGAILDSGMKPAAVQMIKEWREATGGFIINYADDTNESSIANMLNFYVENGSTSDGIVNSAVNDYPQIFASDQPFIITPGINIGKDGSNLGQISTRQGVNFVTVDSRRAAVLDPFRNIMIFGDKFGDGTATSAGPKQNFARFLCDIMAYLIKHANVY